MNKKFNTRIKEIEKEISKIEKRLSAMPEGSLRCHKSGNTYKLYQHFRRSGEHNGYRKYISKKNTSLAQKLATKEYLLIRKNELLHEKKAIEAYLKIIGKGRSGDDYWTQNETLAKLMSSEFKPKSAELEEWQNAPFASTAINQEARIIKAPCGNVRSKSELLIAMQLTRNKIPYRYECDLDIAGMTFHPDFTVRHPKTGEMFIWEHFGLMDNASYAAKAFSKMQSYNEQGLIPSINLIATYETAEAPLDIEYVNALIAHYFL